MTTENAPIAGIVSENGLDALVSTLNNDVSNVDRILTIPTAVTALRPYIAAKKIAPMLRQGEVGVTPWMGLMMMTDAEGSVARLIDKYWPDSGLGSSSLGAKLDPPADTLAMLRVAGAALQSDRISTRAKVAVTTVLGSEGHKTLWAARNNYRHIMETGQQLSFKPSFLGKTATAHKLAALTLAICSHDMEESEQKKRMTTGALVLALGGTAAGEIALYRYNRLYGRSPVTH